MDPFRVMVSRSIRATRASGKQLHQGFLYFFGSHAQKLDFFCAASGAGGCCGLGKAAIMTAKGIDFFVQGQGNITVFTAQGLPAIGADGKGGKPPSIKKDQCLIAGVEGLLQCIL